MISISIPPSGKICTKISFASTLYLHPILDILLLSIPCVMREDLRLGLQEALVNAVSHGNSLDPGKTVCVQFSATRNTLLWVISDQGLVDVSQFKINNIDCNDFPPQDSENGRGLCILAKVFDKVCWDCNTGQLTLYKKISKPSANFRTSRFFLSGLDHVLDMAVAR